LYFERHDGDAATIEDFVKVFADVSGQDFSQFALWYDQAGTPKVEAAFTHDAAKETFAIELTQSLGATPGQAIKKPMHIPIAFGLIGPDGKDMVAASVDGGDVRGDVIHLHHPSETIVFHGIKERPVPSLLRGFSAPVNLTAPLSDDDRAFLALNDSDPVARWQALTGIFNQALLEGAKRIRGGHAPTINDRNAELAGTAASASTLCS